ncbi:InlB B-repeat-containing protein [Granulicatella balaenopterae]|nr:InlB B-repeat-containing protein [Granulicatella balaenopterae]
MKQIQKLGLFIMVVLLLCDPMTLTLYAEYAGDNIIHDKTTNSAKVSETKEALQTNRSDSEEYDSNAFIKTIEQKKQDSEDISIKKENETTKILQDQTIPKDLDKNQLNNKTEKKEVPSKKDSLKVETQLPLEEPKTKAIEVTKPQQTIIYRFLSYKGEEISYQKALVGEELFEPIAPKIEGKDFCGWYLKDSDKKINFPYQVPQPTEVTTKEVILVAHYQETSWIVKYMSQPKGKNGYVMNTQHYARSQNESLRLAEMDSFTVLGDTKTIVGWQDKNGEKVTTKTKVTRDLILYPIIKDVCWLHFDVNGGEPLESKHYKKGEKIYAKTLPTPTRKGYKFLGWTTTNGGNLWSGWSNKYFTINKNMTIKAKWQAAETKVTVVIWRQNVNDPLPNTNSDKEGIFTNREIKAMKNLGMNYENNADYQMKDRDKTYFYAETITVTGKTAEEFNYQKIPNIKAISGDGFYLNKHNTKKNNGTVKVAADGSTIYNIYLDREIITYSIECAYRTLGIRNYHCDEIDYFKKDCVGYREHLTSNWSYLIYKGLYGSECKWPAVKKSYLHKYSWMDNSSELNAFIGTDIEGCDTYGYSINTQDTNNSVRFRRRDLNWAGGDNVYIEKYIDEHNDGQAKLVTTKMARMVSNWSGKVFNQKISDISGYQLKQDVGWQLWKNQQINQSGEFSGENKNLVYFTLPSNEKVAGSTLKVFYEKKSYNFEVFESRNGIVNPTAIYTKKIPYQDEIPDITKEKTKDEVKYHFVGYFEDPNGKKEYHFNGKMPAHNVRIYEVWQPNIVTVTFDATVGSFEPNAQTTISLAAGEYVTPDQLPTLQKHNYYQFKDWEIVLPGKQPEPFEFSRPILVDTVIKARWISDGANLQVNYNVFGKSIQDGQYAAGNKLLIPTIEEVTDTNHNPTDFIGWRSNLDECIYYPGELMEIQPPSSGGEIILTAIWQEDAQVKFRIHKKQVAVKLDAKELNSPITIEKLKNQEVIDTISQLKEKFRVIGWSLQEKDKDNTIKETTPIYINTLDDNNLYAIIAKKSDIKIKMQANGQFVSDAQTFEVKIRLTDASGQAVNGEIDGVHFVDGIGKVMMKSGETKTLNGFFNDYHWQVTSDIPGFTSTIDNEKGQMSSNFNPNNDFNVLVTENVTIDIHQEMLSLPITGIQTGRNNALLLLSIVLIPACLLIEKIYLKRGKWYE